MKSIKIYALAGIAGLAISAAASAAQAATPKLPDFAGPPAKNNPVAKPREIIYSGDGSHFFAGGKGPTKPGRLLWRVWDGNEGLAYGYQWINNCEPSCANGKFSLYPVTLKASKPKQESKYYIFTRLHVTYTGKKYPHAKNFTWAVSYSNGFFDIG
jgi:hypothetical protein